MTRPLHVCLLSTALVAASTAGCRHRERKQEPDSKTVHAAGAGAIHAVVPVDSGPFYPSLARTKDGKPANIDVLGETGECAGCHADAAQQWQSSAHAHASFDNPWYRAVVDQVRIEAGFGASRHCAGCHDPMLLFSGQMDTEIPPDSKLAIGGVTCMLCHGIAETRPDGNASYTLVTEPVPSPQTGDPESLARHRAAVALSPLRTAALCASCHRGFLGRHTGLPHHLSGIEEPGPWRASPWAGSRANVLDEVPQKTCIDCHMQKEPAPLADSAAHDGKIASHRFAGAHTALASLLRDKRQLEALRAKLDSAATVDIPVIWKDGQLWPLERAPEAGGKLAFDVVIRNSGVGHQFPGGVKDMQDTWVEVQVTDRAGHLLATAGRGQSDGEDPSAYALRTLVVDAEGRAQTQHIVNRFGSVAFDHTVPPLGARIVRYTLEVPPTAVPPLRVSARLRHRRHRQEARELACEATRSERGRAFLAAAPKFASMPLDGCEPEPITDVASFEAEVGGGSTAENEPLYRRLYAHAFALAGTVQERLDEARLSIAAALRELDRESFADLRTRANLLALLGRVAARQGRLDEALDLADRAEALVGSQPALDRVRGDAYMQTWHWAEAARMLARVTDRAPGDTSAWRDLARARMSAGDPRAAFDAVLTGLKLQPRDEGLLRCEALSLEALGSQEAALARKAFLFYREADETSASRLLCDDRVHNCARDRQPVVTIDLSRGEPALRRGRRAFAGR